MRKKQLINNVINPIKFKFCVLPTAIYFKLQLCHANKVTANMLQDDYACLQGNDFLSTYMFTCIQMTLIIFIHRSIFCVKAKSMFSALTVKKQQLHSLKLHNLSGKIQIITNYEP